MARPMTTTRMHFSTTPLILAALGIGAAALAVLFSFPADPLAWHAATWTLVAALAGLLVLVPVAGHTLATRREMRTWPRMATFLVGFACLAAVAAGSL